MAGKVDIGACVSFGWNRFKSNVVYYLVGPILVGVGGGLTFGLLAGPLMVGFFKGMMKEDTGGKAEIGDIFSAFDKFVPSLIVVLICVVVSMIPLAGLLVGPLMGTGLYLVAKGENDGMAALKNGFEAYKSDLLMGLICSFVLGVVGSLGAIACGIGMLATLPIAAAGQYLLAQQLLGEAGKANLRAA